MHTRARTRAIIPYSTWYHGVDRLRRCCRAHASQEIGARLRPDTERASSGDHGMWRRRGRPAGQPFRNDARANTGNNEKRRLFVRRYTNRERYGPSTRCIYCYAVCSLSPVSSTGDFHASRSGAGARGHAATVCFESTAANVYAGVPRKFVLGMGWRNRRRLGGKHLRRDSRADHRMGWWDWRQYLPQHPMGERFRYVLQLLEFKRRAAAKC